MAGRAADDPALATRSPPGAWPFKDHRGGFATRRWKTVHSMSARLKALIASLIVVIVVLVGAVAWSLADGGGSTRVPPATIAAESENRQNAKKQRKLQAEIREEQKELAKVAKEKAAERHPVKTPGVTGGGETRPERAQAP